MFTILPSSSFSLPCTNKATDSFVASITVVCSARVLFILVKSLDRPCRFFNASSAILVAFSIPSLASLSSASIFSLDSVTPAINCPSIFLTYVVVTVDEACQCSMLNASPAALATLQTSVSLSYFTPPSAYTAFVHKSPISYACPSAGFSTNTRRLPSAVSCALAAFSSAISVRWSVMSFHTQVSPLFSKR